MQPIPPSQPENDMSSGMDLKEYPMSAECLVAKAKIAEIYIDRTEGVLAEWKASTFASANRVLRDWAQTAPRHGGYHKVRVKYRWDNGLEHVTRVDLMHPSCAAPIDLSAYLQRNILFFSGQDMSSLPEAKREAAVQQYKLYGLYDLALQMQEQCELTDD